MRSTGRTSWRSRWGSTPAGTGPWHSSSPRSSRAWPVPCSRTISGTVNPNQFDVEAMVYVLVWVIVGGTATIYGPILGVVVLTVINEIVLRELGVDQARPLIYGAILIASILFLPDGLESLGAKIRRAFARTRERAGEGTSG